MTPARDWRSLLRDALTQRVARNPAYSQRAFARDVGIPAGRMSEILAGREGLSRRKALDVAGRLGFESQAKNWFADLVDASHARSRSQRMAAVQRLAKRDNVPSPDFHELDAAQFACISDWIHFGILELARTKPFTWNPTWLAQRLGVPPAAVNHALDNLARVGLLRESVKRGKSTFRTWDVVSLRNAVNPGASSDAVRAFHRQILGRATSAIDAQATEERELQSVILALSPDEAAELRAEIREFTLKTVRSLASKRDASTVPTEVYALSSQLFRLTTPTRQATSKA